MTNKLNHLFGWGAAAVIVAAIIGGLSMVGGPVKARDLKIDSKRLKNMHMTARVISCYGDVNDGVPQTIGAAKDALEKGGIEEKKKKRCEYLNWETDPVTKTEFEYKRLGKQSFELCGVFVRADDDQRVRSRSAYNRNRQVLDTSVTRETAGRFCYVAKNWGKT